MNRKTSTNEKAGVQAMREAWRQSTAGLVAVFVFSAFINMSKLAIPLFVFQLLDRVLSSRSLETLFVLTVITVFTVVTGVILIYMRRKMLSHWGVWIEQSFGRQLFLSGLEAKKLQRNSRPTKLLRDLSTLRGFVSGSAVTAWLDIVWAPFFILIVYLIHPLIAALVLVAVFLSFILGFLNEVMTRDARTIASRASLDNNDWIATAERNSQTIGSLNMAGRVAQRWQNSAYLRLRENMRTRNNTLAINNLMLFLAKCLHIGGYALGVWLVIKDEISLGGVIAAGVLGRTAFTSVRQAMSKWRNLTSARSAYQRVKKGLGERAGPMTLTLRKDKPLSLVIEDLSYRYPGQDHSVFRRINMSANPGEIICIIGSSGSGKTTFTKLVAGGLPPRSGVVRLGDVDIHRAASNDLLGVIGYQPQEVDLFQGSVSENIARMGKVDADKIVKAARYANIHDVILRLPQGYDTILDDHQAWLSGGERKAVALARAFYDQPGIVILDEPEANLDRNTRRILRETLLDLKSHGVIIIVTSQDNSFARIADQAILLGASSRARLLKNKGELLDLQRKRQSA